MCVIIYKPKTTILNYDVLNLACIVNPDGLGVCVNNNNKWTLKKYLKPNKKDIKDIIKDLTNKEAIIHSRIATSGGVNLDNCQPFLFDDNKQVLFHNGVITSLNGISKTMSDTRLLITLLETKKVNICDVLGAISERTSNKFILLDEYNTIHFFGDFKEYKGLKCSNLNFIPTPPTFEKEPIYKNYDEFFESRKTLWNADSVEYQPTQKTIFNKNL